MKLNLQNIRLINEHQESGRVFFHTFDGKTIVRIMTSKDVRHAQTIRARQGEAAFKAEMVRLFNEVYSEPQEVRRATMTPTEERLFELRAMRKMHALPIELEAEYQRLRNMDSYGEED